MVNNDDAHKAMNSFFGTIKNVYSHLGGFGCLEKENTSIKSGIIWNHIKTKFMSNESKNVIHNIMCVSTIIVDQEHLSNWMSIESMNN